MNTLKLCQSLMRLNRETLKTSSNPFELHNSRINIIELKRDITFLMQEVKEVLND